MVEIVDEIGNLLSELLLHAKTLTSVPGLHLSPGDCNEIEAVTGLGTTRSVQHLLAAVERLASIRIGDIRLPFTPGQLAELQHRAAKRGHSVEQEMRAVVARIEDELFYKGG